MNYMILVTPSGELQAAHTDLSGLILPVGPLRDLRNQRRLRARGWEVLTIWECELADKISLEKKLGGFLSA